MPGKSIVSLLLVLGAYPISAWAKPTVNPPKPIFFEESWQDTLDWSSGSGQHDWPSSFAVEGGGTCTTNCPPEGWTGFSNEITTTVPFTVSTNVNCADPQNSNQVKCLTYTVETKGDYGTWHGGRMGKLFSKVGGYHEMYVRFKVKYGPTWQWGDCPGCSLGNSTGNQVSMIKNIRIGRFWADPAENSMFNTQGCSKQPSNPTCYSMPIAIPDILENPYYYYVNPVNYRKNVAATLSFRVDPSYYYDPYDGKSPASGGVPAPYFPEDSEWHTLEYRVKMNSAPGVQDGEFEMWIDNSTDTAQSWTHYKTTDVPWLNTGALYTTPEWNNIWLPDNMSRFYNGTQQIYYGPIMAYEKLTNDPLQTDAALWSQSPGDGRLPFDYIIGKINNIEAPAAPSGLVAQ